MSKKSPSSGTEKNQISVKSDADSSEVVDVKGISKDVCVSNNGRRRSNVLISSSDSASDCSGNIHELKQLQANGSSQMANCSSETKEGVAEISDSLDNRPVSLSDRCDNDSLIDRSDLLDDRCYCSDYTNDSIDSRFESLGNYCDENIIFGSHDTNVYCLTNNGNLVWKFETESQVYSTPYIDTFEVKHPSSDKSVVTETDNCPNNRAITNECGHIRESSKILHSIPPGTDMDKTAHSYKFVNDPNRNKVNDSDEKEHHAELNKPENDREGNLRQLKCVEEGEKFCDEGSDILHVKVKPTFSNETVHHTALGETKNYLQRDLRKIQCDKEGEMIHKKDSNSLRRKVKTFRKEEVDHADTNKTESEDKRGSRKLQCVKMAEKIYKEDSDSLGSKVKTIFSNVDNPSVETYAATLRDPTLNVGSLDVVAVASTKGTLYLVGANEGQVLCEMKMRNEIFSSPILYRNSLIIGCRDDNVYCFDIEAIID